MKRLLLMRHAKSDYPAGVDDHDRPLNRRGRLAAPLMGAYLKEIDAVPDLAIVSTASRARETWARMRLRSDTSLNPALYHANADVMLDVARRARDEAETVLLLTHQPGVRDAANRLIGAHEVHQFPTAQIVSLDLEISDWSALAFGGAVLRDIAAPKSLV